MRIFKRISGFIAVLLVVCMLIPCAFAETYDIGQNDITITNTDSGTTVSGVKIDDLNPGSIVITGGDSDDSSTYHSVTITSIDCNHDSSDNNVSITLRDAYIGGGIKASYDLPENLDGDDNNNIVPLPSVPTLDINVSGNTTVSDSISIENMDLNIHSNDAGVLTAKDILIEDYSPCNVNIDNTSLNINGGLGLSIECANISNINIDKSTINVQNTLWGIMSMCYSEDDSPSDFYSGDISLNINSSKIKTNVSMVGIGLMGNSNIKIVNSELDIIADSSSEGENGAGIGIGAISSIRSNLTIESTSGKIDTKGGMAVVLATTSTENNSSIQLNSSVCYPYGAKIDQKDELAIKAFGSKKLNCVYIANADGSPASYVEFGPTSDNHSLYSITDLDGKWVAVKETRDGSILTLAAEADDVILTMTPAQARQLLKNGVEKLVVKTISHEYTLDMVNIVEALKTNEANTVLTTNGSDYKLLIGTDAHPEFVAVK